MGDRHYFLVDPAEIRGDLFSLSETETHHLQAVLRMQPGDEVWLIDGIGNAYQARLSDSTNGVARGKIVTVIPEAGELSAELHLGLGLIKRDRLELAIEKAVELGTASITPLILDRSEKRQLKSERIEKIIISATKQCGRSRFTRLGDPVSLVTWLKHCSGHSILVCHHSGTGTISDWYFSQKTQAPPISVLIGPEGGFSPVELNLLRRFGARFVSLGERRLRSETAAIAALSILNDCLNLKGVVHD